MTLSRRGLPDEVPDGLPRNLRQPGGRWRIGVRGDQGTLKIDRARLAFYRDSAPYVSGTYIPEPEIYVRSSADGTVAHLQNWLDCIRSRKQLNAHIRVAHESARTAHIANAALKAGRSVRWNAAAGTLES